LESGILQLTSKLDVHANLFSTLIDHLKTTGQREGLMKIGCDLHKWDLTLTILMVFLTLRVHFICAEKNKIFQKQKQKKRLWAKLVKQASSN